MRRDLIIEKYGLGDAVIVLERKKIVDLFIDPPANCNFYPPNTFVEAKIQRRISKRGGYFVTLPNGSQGFLKSSIDYSEGEVVVLLSKVFFDEDKPQTFTDKLKIISKYLYYADICVSPGNVGLTAIHSLTYGTPVNSQNLVIMPWLPLKTTNEESSSLCILIVDITCAPTFKYNISSHKTFLHK